MSKQQPKFEDGETVVLKSTGELLSIWRVFLNDCGQPMYEVDGEWNVYEWEIRKPTRVEPYGEDETCEKNRMNRFEKGNRVYVRGDNLVGGAFTGEVIRAGYIWRTGQELEILLDKPYRHSKYNIQTKVLVHAPGEIEKFWADTVIRLS